MSLVLKYDFGVGQRGDIRVAQVARRLHVAPFLLVVLLAPSAGFATTVLWGVDGQLLDPASVAATLFEGADAYVAWSAAGQLLLQRFAPDGSAASGWPAAGVVVHTGSIQKVALVSDTAGGVILVWEEAADIFAQRIDGSGNVGVGWPQPYAVVTDAPEGQRLHPSQPVVVSDGTGGVYVAWGDTRAAHWLKWDGYATRLDSNGQLASGWTPNGDLVVAGLYSNPDLVGATDGAGGLLLAWELSSSLGGQLASVLRLGSNATPAPGWSAAGVTLHHYTETFGSLKMQSVVSDGGGGAYVAWNTDPLNGPAAVLASHVKADGNLYEGVTEGGFVLGQFGNGVRELWMRSDGMGGAHVVWGNEGLFIQRIADGAIDPSWPSGSVTLAGGVNDRPHHVSPDGTGGLFVVYRQGSSETVRALRLRQDLVLYDHIVVSPTPANFTSASVSVTSDGVGSIVAAITSYGNQSRIQRVETDDPMQSSWETRSVNLCTTSFDPQATRVASDGDGGAILAWNESRDPQTGQDVFSRRVLASGALAPGWDYVGTPVAEVVGLQSNPSLVADGFGGGLLAWSDHRNGDFDLYAQRLDATGGATWAAGGVPIVSEAGDQTAVRTVGDGNGGFVAVWRDTRSGGAALFAQRITPSGTVSVGWPAGGVLVTDTPAANVEHVVVSDGQGGCFVAWADDRLGAPDIYAQHVLADGSLDGDWPTGGLAVCTANSTQWRPDLCADGTGGVLITWEDFRDFNFDIYAQRLQSDGLLFPGWSIDGIPVSTNTAWQSDPRVVTDGAGGAYVAWLDNRNGLDATYASRILGNGSLASGWTANGEQLSASVGLQTDLTLMPDGSGGAFVAWADQANGTWQLRVQTLDPEGGLHPDWPTDGLAVYPTTSDQLASQLVPDGAGGAIIVWEDQSNGYGVDLLGQRIRPWGVATDVETLSRSRLLSGSPNPFHQSVDIRFELAAASRVQLEVYDVRGRLVRRLLSAHVRSGARVVSWDGRDLHGHDVGAGVYLVRMVGDSGAVQKRKVVRMR